MVFLQNHTNGYVTLYKDVCFESWLLVPGQLLWSDWVQGCFYVFTILYLFVGIAIAADTFMLSIEMITSKKRIVYTYDRLTQQRVAKEVFVWNETISNLTLMALGSSAPEILISVFETLATLSDTKPKESLGLFTIIGSASYNLIVITAICVMVLPVGTSKRISEFGVFLITSFWSVFAYCWLLFVLRWNSPNIVELWEAVLTFLFFPALVISAWMQDRSCWLHKCRKDNLVSRNKHITELHRIERSGVDNHQELSETNSHVEVKQMKHVLSLNGRKSSFVNPTKDTGRTKVLEEKKPSLSFSSKAFARARFRHGVILSMIGKRKKAERYEKDTTNQLMMRKPVSDTTNVVTTVLQSKPCSNGFQISKAGTFSLSSSSYSVSRSSKRLLVNVLLNRRKKSNQVGFSHIVDATRKKSLFNIGNVRESTIDISSLSNGYNNPRHNKDQHSTMSTQFSFHEAISTRPSLPNVEVSNEISCSRPDDESRVTSPKNNNISEKYSIDKVTESSVVDCYSSSAASDTIINERAFRRSSSIESDNLQNCLLVLYETREGNAKRNKHFVPSSGTLVFSEREYKKSIELKLSDNDDTKGAEDDGKGGEVVDFYVVLKECCHDSSLGDPSIARVSIIDDNEPGEFIFQSGTAHVRSLNVADVAMVTSTVVRIHGSDGFISVHYKTINGTAIGGDEEDLNLHKCDYEKIDEGVINFSPGETSKEISIKVDSTAEKSRTFIIVLYHVTGSAKIGHRCAAIASLRTEHDEILEQVSSLDENQQQQQQHGAITNRQEFRKQIEEAMSLEDEPSIHDMVLHVLCFFWKVLFAFIPPRNIWGGWASFIFSLLILGVLAALVEQFAKLLGCIIGLHVSVTGITLVALGTSMPDTFASKTAALQDDSADAAIGNITGSNSVNVFLGLGLPWVIKASYLYGRGKKLELKGDNLLFSVLVFLACGLFTLFVLILRRMFGGGELGGSRMSKYSTGVILIILWFVFVVSSALQAYGVIPHSVI